MTQQSTLDVTLALVLGEGPGRFTLDVSVQAKGGMTVLFGPSGAGKSLTLQAVAGLVPSVRGHVRVGGRTLLDTAAGVNLPTHERRLGYVPQHHHLFPFCDVAANVAFGLPRAVRRRDHPTVMGLLEEVGLSHLARARPDRLSGGERQRVALARALAVDPELMLLDEPFASIDGESRGALRGLLQALLDRRGIPALFVTHDRQEACVLGHQVVCLDRGQVTRSGAPERVLSQGRRVQRARVSASPGDGTLRLEGLGSEAVGLVPGTEVSVTVSESADSG
jgi:molybdate transport system ATP-binding protein